jgi:hypothetical protein
MKTIILMIGIFFLLPFSLFAADQKLDRKQIYELRKQCGQSAVEFSRRVKLCDGLGDYKNHYNMKFNTCFIDMSASCDNEKGNGDKFWSESVIDVNENKSYANYIGPGKLVDDKPAMCHVGEKQCKSLFEFQKLVKPYMTE